jgi:hypothetical protein
LLPRPLETNSGLAYRQRLTVVLILAVPVRRMLLPSIVNQRRRSRAGDFRFVIAKTNYILHNLLEDFVRREFRLQLAIAWSYLHRVSRDCFSLYLRHAVLTS